MIGVFFFVLGSILGSFYLVIGSRLPIHQNVISDRSRCDSCHEVLRWYELIPLLSYIFLLGKCHHCHKKISPLHFVMELCTALLFLIGYLYYDLTISLGIYLVSVSVTLIIFVSDFKYMIILDSPLVIGSILLIILKYFEGGLTNTIIAIIYGICMFILMFLIKLLGDKIYKKESLGGGDIKLCFFIGLILGYPHIGFRMGLISLILSAFLAFPYALASVYLYKKNELPYGPFLIAAAVIVFIFLDKFSRLLSLFSLT